MPAIERQEMPFFRAAAGSGDDWVRACDDCLASLGRLPTGANLGIIYASGPLAHAIDLVAERMREATGIQSWVGSGGNAICTNARDITCDSAIGVMAATLPSDGFRLFDGTVDERRQSAGLIESSRFALVHGDPRQAKVPSMIESLSETTGAFLFGGLTSTGRHDITQIAGHPTEGGLSGVLMDETVPLITELTQGCTPIGPMREITGIDGPWITSLDGEPAHESLEQDIGPILARDLERISGFIMAARPEGELEPNGYLVRDLGEVDRLKGAIMVGDDFRRGDQLCFVKRDPEGARVDLRRVVRDLKKRAGERPILGALYHSCIGRGRHLFGTEDAEIGVIEDELGQLPLIGLSTHGEIFRNRLYGYSAVLTLFLA
jgi:small ligand-binding sensory domain FIST